MSAFSLEESANCGCNALYPLVAIGDFPAATGAPVTTVDITVASGITRSLVFTVQPSATLTGGVMRVAAVQTVVSEVFIDFAKDLPLYWLASARRAGDVAPNQDANPYYSADSHDPLCVASDIVITWNGNAWRIPPFDSSNYVVQLGFGLRLGADGFVSWAYSVPCQPNSTLALDVGAYAIYQSNGSESLGDPVDLNQPTWSLPLGHRYSLTFDKTGQGYLTEQS